MRFSVVDLRAIESKFAIKIGDSILANLVIKLYGKYLFCLGVISGRGEEYFENDENSHLFRILNDLEGMYGTKPLLRSEIFFKIIKKNLKVNELVSNQFSQAEAEHWIEMGWVTTPKQAISLDHKDVLAKSNTILEDPTCSDECIPFFDTEEFERRATAIIGDSRLEP